MKISELVKNRYEWLVFGIRINGFQNIQLNMSPITSVQQS
jgi:hypothetical protein